MRLYYYMAILKIMSKPLSLGEGLGRGPRKDRNENQVK
jgi:hypothetical protein